MTLRCYILEDQAPARRVMENYLARLEDLTVVGGSAVPAEAAQALDRQAVDLLLLDLGLPQQDGFDFLAQRETPPVVIVTTAFGERALEGFNHGVADYLVKPFTFERFSTAIERARIALRARGDSTILSIPVDRGRREYVPSRDVVSFSADGDYVVINTLEARYYTLGPLTAWLARVPCPPFIRIHRSHAVNQHHITGLDGRAVILAGNRLPVSATHMVKLKRLLDAMH
ncbi:MAG: LytTR family DNA-binding domain-containing protein [Pseudomonadales bacterium]